MHKSRYVVVNLEGAWTIKQAGRHLSGSYPSKTEALTVAIGFAEKDGSEGHQSEVLVRTEDDHFVTEWACGPDPGGPTRPLPRNH